MMREHALEQEREIEEMQQSFGEHYLAHIKETQNLHKFLVKQSLSMNRGGEEYQKTKNMINCLEATAKLLCRTSSASLSTADTQSIHSNSEYWTSQAGIQGESDETAEADESGSICWDPFGGQVSAENVQSWIGHEDSSDFTKWDERRP